VIRILLAVNDPRMADHLSGLIAESDELQVTSTVRDPQELRGGLPRHDVDAVLVHERLGALPLIEVVRELTVAQPDLGLVMIVGEGSPELLRSGMQAGARDVLAGPIGLEQLESSVMAAAAWTHAVRRRAARDADGELIGVGRVVAVVGSKGGVGTTTIATHLALAARELGDASVCLVEYDLQAGDLRAFLDLPYRRSVVDLVPVADELISRHLQESLYTHPSGMRVLLGPQEGERAEEVKASAARNILTAIRTREDLTIVDAGSTLTEASAIAVEMADTVLIVTTPDVVSLRGVSRLCSLWDRLKIAPPEVAVLLNRTSRKLEVQPDLARRVVPAPVLETNVPADFFSLEAAANTGIPAADAASNAVLGPMAGVLGEISALPAKEPTAGRADRARSIAARLAGESGQASIELMGSLGALILLFLFAWQLVLVGTTFVFAGHAARAGAAALAVGDKVDQAATADLPGPWQNGVKVSESQIDQDSQSVTVKVPVPLLVPGLITLPSIQSTDRTVIEDQLLPGEQQAFASFAPFGGGPIGGGTATVGPALLATLQTWNGPVAKIDPATGEAIAPADAPIAVKEMIAAANEIRNTSYEVGGGHTGPLSTLYSSYDCSGATSFVLYAADEWLPGDDMAEASGPMETYGDAGPGKWVSVYASSGHAFIVIAGLAFDTADYGGPNIPAGSGPRWRTCATCNLSDGGDWTVRHPANL
jgi:pilus assembly protein CpaE